MGIPALITMGIGPGGSIKYVMTGGLDIGSVFPIVTLITNRITSLINNEMTQANGFSQDYGSVNEYDPDARTYPAVFYEYPEEETIDQGFTVGNRVSETTTFGIRVQAATGSDLEVVTDRIIADFNKLFAEFQGDLKNKGLIDYDYLGSTKEKPTVASYPVELVMNYSLSYRRILDDIFTVDSSDTAETYSGSAYGSPTPVWNAITAQIETLIAAMTPVNGYQYDYGTVDQTDPDSRAWPAISLDYPEEEGLDENEFEAYKYTLNQELTIKISGVSASDIDQVAMIYRSDFNKMFAANHASLEAVGMRLATYQGSTTGYTSIAAYPMTIDLNYLIVYSRQKKNPYLT